MGYDMALKFGFLITLVVLSDFMDDVKASKQK